MTTTKLDPAPTTESDEDDDASERSERRIAARERYGAFAPRPVDIVSTMIDLLFELF